MKLKDCLEIGLSCDLETVGEALRNIYLHSMNLFTYEEADDELLELSKEFTSSGIASSTAIMDALDVINKGAIKDA